jgi:beta-glucosidase
VALVNSAAPYQDRTAPVPDRVSDLLGRMTLAEKAGLLFHTMIGIGRDGQLAPADPDASLLSNEDLVGQRGMNHFNVVDTASPREFALWHNRLQELAASTRLGIPVTLSSDPRHARTDNPNTAVLAGEFSQWPEPLGLAATRDPRLVEQFADTVRQEYRAVGLRLALHPQADLATEPRWPRVVGTFVHGLQGPVLGPFSVAAMTKHFPGGGPQKGGEDAHFASGRELVYPGGRFGEHLKPFLAAVEAGTAQMMPYYAMPVATGYEEVGIGFNHDVITGLLRERMGFNGVVCTDWGLLTGARYRGETRPARAWGVEDLSPYQRAQKILNAGADQFGGEALPELVVRLVAAGAVSEERLDVSVRRLLREKFILGLFDNPYVDPDEAEATVGRPDFRAAGLAAQRASVTLLKNAALDCPAHLPLRPGLRVYGEGVDPAILAQYASTVDDIADADVAILRLATPYEHRTGEYAAFFHSGSLEFPAAELDRILAIADRIPTIVDIYLDRPAVIPALADRIHTLVASFGVNDVSLLDVLTGRDEPRGQLPFDLPHSMAAVANSAADVAASPAPVFPFGHGLSY